MNSVKLSVLNEIFKNDRFQKVKMMFFKTKRTLLKMLLFEVKKKNLTKKGYLVLKHPERKIIVFQSFLSTYSYS